MADLPMVGCMTQVSITWDVSDPLGLHLNQKAMKLGQKWPSYGQFTKERLRDSSEYHMGCMGSIGASFKPKSYEIGPEMNGRVIAHLPMLGCVTQVSIIVECVRLG